MTTTHVYLMSTNSIIRFPLGALVVWYSKRHAISGKQALEELLNFAGGPCKTFAKLSLLLKAGSLMVQGKSTYSLTVATPLAEAQYYILDPSKFEPSTEVLLISDAINELA